MKKLIIAAASALSAVVAHAAGELPIASTTPGDTNVAIERSLLAKIGKGFQQAAIDDVTVIQPGRARLRYAGGSAVVDYAFDATPMRNCDRHGGSACQEVEDNPTGLRVIGYQVEQAPGKCAVFGDQMKAVTVAMPIQSIKVPLGKALCVHRKSVVGVINPEPANFHLDVEERDANHRTSLMSIKPMVAGHVATMALQMRGGKTVEVYLSAEGKTVGSAR